jgi:hypothetical protein
MKFDPRVTCCSTSLNIVVDHHGRERAGEGGRGVLLFVLSKLLINNDTEYYFYFMF